MKTPDLIVVGASARAACESAARAGFAPYWIDQFGDLDLAERFPGARVATGRYPDAITDLVGAAPDAPFMYTGAMENHRTVLRRAAALRPLLGNDAATCAAVRDPVRLASCFSAAGIEVPAVRNGTEPVPAGRWLRKPLSGGGGLGIEVAAGNRSPADTYLQAFVEGEDCSAVYVGDGSKAALVGVTLQLVGRPEFHAPPFAYCGSIGPLPLSAAERAGWDAIGAALVRSFGLRGLFGVDAVRRKENIVPVEVNPRYTASVEVHEHAGGPAAIALHVEACRGTLPALPAWKAGRLMAKAYLFAPGDLHIGKDLRAQAADMPSTAIADVPAPGTPVRAGAPIMTILCRGENEGACARLLALGARRLYKTLA